MQTFVCSLSWTDKGIQSVNGIGTRRTLASTEVAEEFGITVKEILYTSGDIDILYILEAPSGEAVAKWALFIGSRGFVRTRTARAFTPAEFDMLLDDVLPRLLTPRPAPTGQPASGPA